MLLLALCLPLLILALLRFDFYICAVVFLLPVYPFIDWKLPVRDAFLLAHFVLFVGICVVQVRNGVPWRGWLWQGWMRKGMIAFTAVAAGSLVLSESRDIEGAAKALAKLLSYTAVFLSVAAWAVTRERIVRIIKLLLISTIAVCVFGLYQAIVGDFTSFYFQLYPDMEPVFMAGGGWVGRITSFLFHYNSLAGYLNAIMPLALAVTVLGRKTGLRRLAFICLCLSWAAVFFTGSRGGLVALGAVLLSAMFYLRPRGRTTAVVLAAAFLASSVMLSISMERPGIGLNDSHQGADDLSFDTRLALWGAAGALFLEHPVAGAGFGTYRFAMQQYLPGVRDQLDAHNLYLQTLAETGIIGFLVFFLTISVFFRGSFRLIKHADPLLRTIGFAVCAAIGATLVHGLVDYLFITSPQFGNLFWLLLGLGVAAREGEQRFATPALEEGVF
ncbi:MAG TPA: O-antigen ligase family protein [Candidatus Angelobacter sp.]|nr:O-antigen ligase family protein [Candidatus Angelobacter sp.]